MIEDFFHEYMGFGRVPSHCRVKIFTNNGENFICFEDIGEGTSVTNASEQLATEIVDLKDFNPTNCRFFETYSQYNYDSFDEIIYQWAFVRGRWEAKHPDWKPAEKEMQKAFIK
jgi:hypothetical protein